MKNELLRIYAATALDSILYRFGTVKNNHILPLASLNQRLTVVFLSCGKAVTPKWYCPKGQKVNRGQYRYGKEGKDSADHFDLRSLYKYVREISRYCYL